MSLKDHILDSNGLIYLKLSVDMEIWLIFDKNSKISLIFANFGYFGNFRVEKMTFLLSKKAYHPYGLQQKWLQILRRTTRRLVAMWYFKKAKFRTKISNMPIFDIWTFFIVSAHKWWFLKNARHFPPWRSHFWQASRLSF